MKYVAVMPWIVPEYMDACLAGCRFDPLLVVDNYTGENLGVMRSHNLGVDFMREQDADWLIILSAAIRFGPEGGLDFVNVLATTHRDAHVVNAVGVYGWHLMAFSRETVEAAGRWDENFHPYGFDDNDYAIRIHKALPDAAWWGTSVEVTDTIMGHSIKLGPVRTNANPQLAYFKRKWGDVPGPPFEAYHDRPFDDTTHTVRYWPPPKDLGPVDGAAWDEPVPRPPQATVR